MLEGHWRTNACAFGIRWRADQIIDLRCPNPQSLIEPIKDLPEIRDASLFGSGLHLVTADGDNGLEAVKRLLTQLGLAQGITIETIMPSMEDVFISLIEEVDRRNGETQSQQVAAS